MNLLGYIAGIAGISIAAEEITPLEGTPHRDLIAYLTHTYEFSPQALSMVSQNAEVPPITTLANGVFTDADGQRIAISQLIIGPDGDLVVAQNTKLAGTILADYLERLERDLNFRISGARVGRVFSSTLLVEFSSGAVEALNSSSLGVVLDALHAHQTSRNLFKRLSFGTNASSMVSMMPTIDQFLSTDFIIERRANEPMEANRFFCYAPVSTERHIEILEAFEKGLT